MLDNLSKYDIILASNSPRRKEILGGLDLKFEVRTLSGIDESYPDTLKGEEIPLHIAKKKAEAYKALLNGNTMIITADTIVWDGERVMGKPKDEADAKAMLRALSGKQHMVYTGVTINTKEKSEAFVASSKVKFAELRDEDIEYYVSKYKPMDKAGSYGIQEWIGYIAVEGIEGSF